ncbi:hypothetical protein D9M72_408580 [compost metagenome]
MVGAGIGEQPGFRSAERHGEIGRKDRIIGLAGVGVHAAGNVAGHHKTVRGGAQLPDEGGRCAAEPALGSGPQHRVDHDVGAGGCRCQLTGVVVGEGPGAPAGPFKGGQSVRVGLAGGEYRCRTHSAGCQEGGGEEPVSPVVALAGKNRHAGPVGTDPPGNEFTDNGVGQTVGGPLHEDSSCPGQKKGFFGLTNLGAGVGADHWFSPIGAGSAAGRQVESARLPFREDGRRGDSAVVAHRQVPALDALGLGDGQHGALDLDGGSVLVKADPAVLPVHAGGSAQDLGHGFLGRKARGQGARVQLALGRDEQPVPEPWGPFQLPAEPFNVYDVYANTNNHAAYSTVTLLARLRGWSTSYPLAVASSRAKICSGTVASRGARSVGVSGM